MTTRRTMEKVHREQAGVQLDIILEKLSGREHALAYRRADGSGERLTLDTRGFLLHDLAHLAVETAFKRRDGVFGRLAAGVSYEELRLPTETGLDVEKVVVRLQSSWRDKKPRDEFVKLFTAAATDTNFAVPDWVTASGLQKSWDILRQLDGRWRATPFHEAMHIHFEV